ncbi:hypothetical protein GCM10027347_55550 [Larkinella harenae]
MQFFKPRYTLWTINTANLWLRLGLGVAMLPHGYEKLTHFGQQQADFLNLFGLGSAVSLALAIGAEFFCSIFLMLGLLTRLVLIPLLVTALVIVFVAHQGDIAGDGSAGFLFLIGYFTCLLLGAGKYSLDAIIFRT